MIPYKVEIRIEYGRGQTQFNSVAQYADQCCSYTGVEGEQDHRGRREYPCYNVVQTQRQEMTP